MKDMKIDFQVYILQARHVLHGEIKYGLNHAYKRGQKIYYLINDSI